MFTEVNPDKGTETLLNPRYSFFTKCLQKLTPIRGRKRVAALFISAFAKLFTEVNPDKGTETFSGLV